jgi:hypothetical protein
MTAAQEGSNESKPAKFGGIVLDDCEAEIEVNREAVGRTFELLACWALRRGRDKGVLQAGDAVNRVTGYGIKGYGANDGSN